MTRLILLISLIFPGWAAAQEDMTLDSLTWLKRPVVIFADTPQDPRFIRQMELLEVNSADLEDRDVVILTDTSPADKGPLRIALRPRGFMLVLIGKDGRVALRKPSPWSTREISRAIDKWPLRLDELQDR